MFLKIRVSAIRLEIATFKKQSNSSFNQLVLLSNTKKVDWCKLAYATIPGIKWFLLGMTWIEYKEDS